MTFHPTAQTVAQKILDGEYEPPDELFRADRSAYAEAIRRLEARFESDAIASVGYQEGRPARAILATARALAGSGDRLAVLKIFLRLAHMLDRIEADVPGLRIDTRDAA